MERSPIQAPSATASFIRLSWARSAALEFSTALAGDGALLIRIGAPGADLDRALGFEVSGFTGNIRVLDSQDKPLDFGATARDGRLYLARTGSSR